MFALTESRVDAFIMCDVKQCFWFVLIFLVSLHYMIFAFHWAGRNQHTDRKVGCNLIRTLVAAISILRHEVGGVSHHQCQLASAAHEEIRKGDCMFTSADPLPEHTHKNNPTGI